MEITKKSKESINLIPEEEREKSISSQLVPVAIFITIILIELGIFGFLIFLNNTSENAIADTKQQIGTQTLVWQKYEPVATTLKTISTKKVFYDQKSITFVGLDNKLDVIRNDIPQGISYNTLNVNLTGKTVINGKAADPKVIYQYYNELLSKSNYKLVTLNSVSKSGLNYTFDLSFTLSDTK